MSKQIPIYFDTVVVDSPFQGISEATPNIGRLKVRVFTKYANRNGSYITDAVAEQLIQSATTGNTPVVGFFDPGTQTWASHSGPTLANGYGYVENFLGWEPFEDSDGVIREYAVFSVVLFTDYYEEAKKIFGQNQSMELNPNSIDGDWTMINGQEYFVYTQAKMLGFCVIGEHEPCFSVSSFFSKNDDTYKSQYEKFSSLLFDLKTKVEEAEKNIEGGEQPMTELENQEVVEEAQVEEAPETFQEETTVEETIETVTSTEEVVEPEAAVTIEPETSEATEFEQLQQQFNDLQTSYNELQSNYENAQNRITELEEFQTNANNELETLRARNTQLQTSLQSYEAQALEAEKARKNGLVEKYKKVLTEEEINTIAAQVNDFSYDELESKLAIVFANNKIIDSEAKKIPLLDDTPQTGFARLIQKYKKN